MKSESDSDEYQDPGDKREKPPQNRRKRRKGNDAARPASTTLNPTTVFDKLGNGAAPVESFQDIMDNFLPDFLRLRATLHENTAELDDHGQRLRPLTRSEVSTLSNGSAFQASHSVAIAVRKLKLIREKSLANLPPPNLQAASTVTPLPPCPSGAPSHPDVLNALYDIKTTPFESSFVSRIRGGTPMPDSIIAVDWETATPWMSLMSDIREHYVLAHPEREKPVEPLAPIIYTCLQARHLDQVHDLLARVFWSGINVSDSLDHSPERCTVVATYKRLVVGVAILSSPRETYITYLAVKAGWDNAGIARSMLYHLIKLNPHHDIILHVSVNNSAMLLYNQFGFKAEGFVAGFYETYLDPSSRASKNAFRLRLRQQ